MIWCEVWSLKVPNAVKMFMWRASHNLLPTKENMQRKGIVNESSCPICGRTSENIAHILCTCPLTMDVWGNENFFFFLQKCPYNESDFL
jgi:hypothetical protein